MIWRRGLTQLPGRRIAVSALLCVLLVSAGLLHLRLVTDLDRADQNSPTEAEMLHGLRSVRNGQKLYHDFAVPPHVLTQYTPLFYLVPGTMARLLDASAVNSFVIGRCYVYLFWLGVALAICGLARQTGSPLQISILATLLWLAGRLATDWSNSFRPDAPAVFFSLAALWLCQRGRDTAITAGTVALLVIAFLHKQSAVIALCAIFVEELRHKRVARAAVLLGSWVATLAAVVWIAQAVTNGSFVKNAFTSLIVFQDVQWPVYFMLAALTAEAAVFSGAALACATIPADRCPSLLKRYFVASFAFAFLTSGKAGAGVNYYLEPWAAACVLCAALVRDRQVPGSGRAGMLVPLGWAIWALAFSIATLLPRVKESPQLARDIKEHRTIRQRETDDWERIGSRISALGQPVLIEHPYLALRLEAETIMMDPPIFKAMQRDGKFDETDLLRRTEQRQFKAIVASRFPLDVDVYDRPFSQRWIEPMRRRYVLTEIVPLESQNANFYIYQPAN